MQQQKPTEFRKEETQQVAGKATTETSIFCSMLSLSF